ncbi:MAG: hypothetical protein JKX76_01330 [Colwellia sp.]|nr:hypothetical protein [Colwellia sp.]
MEDLFVNKTTDEIRDEINLVSTLGHITDIENVYLKKLMIISKLNNPQDAQQSFNEMAGEIVINK